MTTTMRPTTIDRRSSVRIATPTRRPPVVAAAALVIVLLLSMAPLGRAQQAPPQGLAAELDAYIAKGMADWKIPT